MRPTRIEVHIEELLVTGVPGVDRDELTSAVTQALQQALAQGLAPQLTDAGHIDRLDAGRAVLPERPGPGGAAVPIAGAIAGALGGTDG